MSIQKTKKLNIDEIKKSLLESERKDWFFEFDKDLDSLSWGKKKISENAILTRPFKEFAFYLLPNGKIEGMVIDYFSVNFLKHNEEFEEFQGLLSKKQNGELYTVDTRKKTQVEHFKKDLARAAIEEITELEFAN